MYFSLILPIVIENRTTPTVNETTSEIFRFYRFQRIALIIRYEKYKRLRYELRLRYIVGVHLKGFHEERQELN